jgi:hypothetical protein
MADKAESDDKAEKTKLRSISEKEASERLKALDARLEQLKVQRANILARRKATEAKVKRGADTRRKILVGSMILAKLDQADEARAARARTRLAEDLDAYLTREDDRALFPDLLPKAGEGGRKEDGGSPEPELVRQTDSEQGAAA